MTHEIKLLFQTLTRWQSEGKKGVFASVVALEGTSYRKPGVRMAICEDGEIVGAVSGGCVENKIVRQAQSVFQNGKSKVMTYDGRLRIGCEGIIHILIEPILLSDVLLINFKKQLKNRIPFQLKSWFHNEVGEYSDVGSVLIMEGKTYPLQPAFSPSEKEKLQVFTQEFSSLFQLYIFGAEHDAVQLSQSAKLLGWEVTVVASPEEAKSCDYFPGTQALVTPAYDEVNSLNIDGQTAIVLMTHSFNKDVQYLLALKDFQPAYIGLLGPFSRRERVLSMVLDYMPEFPLEFLEQIHGPAGINIGAENAAEIAVSILSEILSVVRKQTPIALRDKTGSIHG